jgi:hypothetical protein
MTFQTLLGQVTPEALEKIPVGRTRQVRNAKKVEQHLNAFALHLRGVSFRGVQEELGLRNVGTAEHSIRRGEQLAKQLGLDTDRIKLKLAAWFEELADITMRQVRQQVESGQMVISTTADGCAPREGDCHRHIRGSRSTSRSCRIPVGTNTQPRSKVCRI